MNNCLLEDTERIHVDMKLYPEYDNIMNIFKIHVLNDFDTVVYRPTFSIKYSHIIKFSSIKMASVNFFIGLVIFSNAVSTSACSLSYLVAILSISFINTSK